MKFVLNYLLKYKKILFGALILAAVNQIFSLLDPQIFRLLIDNYASKISVLTASQFLRGVGILLVASVGAAFVSRTAKNFQDYFVNVITQRVGAQMYAKGISHSFSLPYSTFEDQRSGELLQKLQKTRSDVQLLISNIINTLFFSLVGVAFVLVYAFYVHWSIGLAYAAIIPALGGATFLISRRVKVAQKRIFAETAELAGSTTETLRNVELVKSLGLENQETGRLNRVNDEILKLELKKIRYIRTLSFIQGTLINAFRSLILLLMLWLIYTRIITLGEFFSILFYSFFIFNPLSDMGNVITQYQEAMASVDSFQGILRTPSEPKPEKPGHVGTLLSIDFDKVDFSYEGNDKAAVQNISLRVEKGESVAFVGPSGSGKTTMVKLVLGLYSPVSGKMLLNGEDYKNINKDEFKERVGYVSQDTQLFAGTIRDNLLFVNPEANDEECMRALKQAAALNIIERGDKGLDTKIGEGGIKISGGEKQRLAIARALLRDPELVIFDEATSSLDSITERSITETIKEIKAERPNLMLIMVAHRLSTIAHADTIYVMERGKISEKGNHHQLIGKRGLYAALWREQSAEEGEEMGEIVVQ